jgi:hypothetical protein
MISSVYTIYFLLYSIFTTCFDLMWSSSGITTLYNHLDTGFYFPYTGQCLHVGQMLACMYALLSEFVLYKIKLHLGRVWGPSQPPIEWVPRALSPGVKWLGHETHFLPSSSAEFKNGGAIRSLPHTSPPCAELNKKRENVTFYLIVVHCLHPLYSTEGKSPFRMLRIWNWFSVRFQCKGSILISYLVPAFFSL